MSLNERRDRETNLGALGQHMTRMMRVFLPSWRRPTFWVVVGLVIGLVLWELDLAYTGVLYARAKWLYESVLCRHPVIPFVLGGLAFRWLWPMREKEDGPQ